MKPFLLLRHPSAFLPVVMSLAALSTMLLHFARHGPALILALQVAAALAAMAPVFLLRW